MKVILFAISITSCLNGKYTVKSGDPAVPIVALLSTVKLSVLNDDEYPLSVLLIVDMSFWIAVMVVDATDDDCRADISAVFVAILVAFASINP